VHSNPFTLPVTDPVLIVALAMGIFFLAPLAAQAVRVPGILGILVTGAIVGPNGLNLLARDQTIVLLGTWGLLYLMFLAGIEIDLHGFRKYRNRSVIFGALTFLLPQALGTWVGRLLGYDWPTSILLASMFASHTLLAYPVAIRFGIGKNQAVTTAVGGTIITDTAALLVLAVIASSTRGELDTWFWIQLVVLLSIYVVTVWHGLPRLGRWLFRHERIGPTAEFVFVIAALFGGAFLAELAGVEAIVGAFLVGLALNRLIPEQSLMVNRIHFVGDAIFIPFFLLSVGMLVDVRVLAGDVKAWQVMIGMSITVMATKWMAAELSRRLFGYSSAEGWTVFGLTVPQAAATLAATLIGLEIGLFDDAILNGVIMMIFVTCLVGPWVVERYGRTVALEEGSKPYNPWDAPQRILVPMAKPASAPGLVDLSLMIREPDSNEPIYPLTVVPDLDDPGPIVADAEKMLAVAVEHATAAGVRVQPLTRIDLNFARGMARAATESRASALVIGWDGRPGPRRRIFGRVLDELLDRTKVELLVAKLGHPLATTERLVVVVPDGEQAIPGYLDAVRTVKRLANRLGAQVVGLAVDADPVRCQKDFEEMRPDAPVEFQRHEGWGGLSRTLKEMVVPDDLVVVLSARQGSVAWSPELDTLPGVLAALAPESFVMLYPAEEKPRRAVAEEQQSPGTEASWN